MAKKILVCMTALLLSGCSCKEWGYCAHVFPNAERFADTSADECSKAASGDLASQHFVR